jgi:thiol-disulfide isomerase/thioredoxin
MQKSLMAVIASLVAAAIILVSVGAVRERHAAAAAHQPLQTSSTAKAAKSQPAPGSKDGSKDSPDDTADDDGASVIRLVRDPSPAPPFLLADLDGQPISTAAYHGKVVLINFWATWCPPCREEIPEMIGLADKFKDNLQIIGVSMDDEATPSEVRDFAHNEKMNYPIVMGSDKLSEEYGGIPALPTTFVLDTNGRVVQKHMGLYPEEVYDGEIRALLGMHVDEPVKTFVDTGQIFLKNVARATELPGVDFSGLTPGLKKIALKRLNSELCTCGCKMTIAQCRMNDADCATSKALAAKIIRQVKAEANAPEPTAQNR